MNLLVFLMLFFTDLSYRKGKILKAMKKQKEGSD
jgi:hypothetical protein